MSHVLKDICLAAYPKGKFAQLSSQLIYTFLLFLNLYELFLLTHIFPLLDAYEIAHVPDDAALRSRQLFSLYLLASASYDVWRHYRR